MPRRGAAILVAVLAGLVGCAGPVGTGQCESMGRHAAMTGDRPSTSAGRSTRRERLKCRESEPQHEQDGEPDPSPRLTAVRPPRHAQHDDVRRVASLLASAEERLRQQLLVASEQGKRHAVYLLLHQGIDANYCRGLRGFTPMHHAATRAHLEVLQLLFECGAKPDITNDSLETSLHLACFNGHVAIAEFLLDHGANINALTVDHETPLFYAARKNQYRVVRLLIRRECDLLVRNRFGDVAEDEATSEKTQMEFAVGLEDLSRLYQQPSKGGARRPASKAHALPSKAPEQALLQIHRELVLSFLDLRSLCRACQVCYRWHRAADSPALWRQLGVSRWELLLQSSVTSGAIAPLAFLRRSNDAALTTPTGFPSALSVVARPGSRPSSCGITGSRFLMPTRTTSSDQRRDARPQTARTALA